MVCDEKSEVFGLDIFLKLSYTRYLLKMMKKTLFSKDYCNGILQWQGEIRLNSEYDKDKWRSIAKGRDGRQLSEKLLRGNFGDSKTLARPAREDSC